MRGKHSCEQKACVECWCIQMEIAFCQYHVVSMMFHISSLDNALKLHHILYKCRTVHVCLRLEGISAAAVHANIFAYRC